MSRNELINSIINMINEKKTSTEICQCLNIDLSMLYRLVLELKRVNQRHDIIDGNPVIIDGKESNIVTIDPQNRFAFCSLSDIHYGSKYDRPDIIRHVYDLCEQKGIDTILCSGDLTDGSDYGKRERYDNQKVHSIDEMVDYVVNVHPYSDHIKFYTISGNHDESFYRRDGVNVIDEIARMRSDIIPLGSCKARVRFGDVSIQMDHGKGRSSNGIVEKARNYYDFLDSKPDIITFGHVHHSFFTKFEDTFVLQNAALIDQIPSMERYGVTCERSTFFVNLEYDEKGKLIDVLPRIQSYGQARVRSLK